MKHGIGKAYCQFAKRNQHFLPTSEERSDAETPTSAPPIRRWSGPQREAGDEGWAPWKGASLAYGALLGSTAAATLQESRRARGRVPAQVGRADHPERRSPRDFRRCFYARSYSTGCVNTNIKRGDFLVIVVGILPDFTRRLPNRFILEKLWM